MSELIAAVKGHAPGFVVNGLVVMRSSCVVGFADEWGLVPYAAATIGAHNGVQGASLARHGATARGEDGVGTISHAQQARRLTGFGEARRAGRDHAAAQLGRAAGAVDHVRAKRCGQRPGLAGGHMRMPPQYAGDEADGEGDTADRRANGVEWFLGGNERHVLHGH
jgi:hypothetical protein